MKKSSKLLLITFISILVIILVLAVALRMQARSYSYFLPLDDEHATFVNIATESANEKHIPLTIVVSMPTLRAIETKGMSNIRIIGFNEKNMLIDTKGIQSIEGINNRITHLLLLAKGTSNIDLSKSKIVNAKIDLKGTSSANLQMDGGTLSGVIKGIASLTYSGKVKAKNIFHKGLISISQN